MTLRIPTGHRHHRLRTQQYIYLAKRQLVGALASGSPTRIRKAKLTLARHLRELAESPELGPPLTFHPGKELILAAQMEAGGLCWDCMASTLFQYGPLARYLEFSAGAELPAVLHLNECNRREQA